MSERKPMDDLFRDRLYHHSTQPPMHLWEAMDARLSVGATPNKRRWGLWLSVVGLLLLCAGGTLLYLGKNTERKASPVQQEMISPPAEKTEPVATIKDPTTSEQPFEVRSKDAVPANNSNSVARQPINQAAQAVKKSAPSKQDEKPAMFANTATLANKIETPVPTPVDQVNEGSSLQLVAASETNEVETPLSDFASLHQTMKPLEYVSNLGLEGGGPLYIPSPRGWRVYGEILAALDVPTRQMSAQEPEYETYRLAREQSESVLNGQRAALRFSMISVDGFAVRSGLSYGQHRERLNLPQQSQLNRFHTVDIPVVLGYERNQVGKFSFSANAGVYLNMAFSQSGQFLAPDLQQILDFSSKTPDAYPAFRNRLGVSWYGSFAASYPITPRLRLVLEPYILHHTGSVTHADYAIDQRYQNWGIQIGLRKKINKYIYFARP